LTKTQHKKYKKVLKRVSINKTENHTVNISKTTKAVYSNSVFQTAMKFCGLILTFM